MRAGNAVVSTRRVRLGALVLREVPLQGPDPDQVTAVLLDGIRRSGLESLPWTDDARRLQHRLVFLHRLDHSSTDCSDRALLDTRSVWLGPHLAGFRRLDDLGRLNLANILLGLLPGPARRSG